MHIHDREFKSFQKLPIAVRGEGKTKIIRERMREFDFSTSPSLLSYILYHIK